MSTAAAYLRRSVSKDPTKEVSREAQEAACRRLVGGAPLALYVDWNISGGSTRGRPEYQRLRADVEAGRVSSVVAYSISRLARSARELLDFLEVCKAHGVTVTTDAEGSLGGRGAFAKFQYLMMAGIAEMERDLASERTLAAHAVRRERGDHIGPAPYGMRLEARETALAAGHARGLVPDPAEDFGAVVTAYRETHNLHGTALRLNEAKVPSRSGRPWTESSVRGMLRARAPEIMPRVKGVRAGARGYLFTALLVCPFDDSRLAAKANHGRWPAYACRRALEIPGHPFPRAVSEAYILPWMIDEIAHIDLGGDRAEAAAEDAAARAALTGRLERANELYLAGRITRERSDAEAAAVAAEMDGLAGSAVVQDLGDLDDLWTWAPRDTNATLRAILERVTLGADLRPTLATWRNPALRLACDDPACTHCQQYGRPSTALVYRNREQAYLSR
jgi:DNA invertase Pin-like site-specific DNA recombinase